MKSAKKIVKANAVILQAQAQHLYWHCTFQGVTHCENELKNGTFYTDLLIKRGLVANSQEISIKIGDRIDETIQFLEQSLMSLRA